MRKSLVALWTVAGLLIGSSAVAKHPVAAGVAELDSFLRGLQTLQADFRQELRDGNGRLIESSSGTLAIHRPDRFRWDYKAPHPQVIVADGTRLWLYDVDLEQVTVRPLEQSLSGTPASLLAGNENLRATFNVARVDSRGGVTAYTLMPKRADTDFSKVRLTLRDGTLDAIELLDKLGQSTLLEFSNVRRNDPIDDAEFAFSPPPGVDVIGATAQVGETH